MWRLLRTHAIDTVMNYLQAYRFLFNNPKWWQTLLAGAVCVIVPIMGPIVLLGYGFCLIENWHRCRSDRYPDFDLNQLVKYMLRGVWPFLVQLVIWLPAALFIAVAYFVGIFAILQPQRNRPPTPGKTFAFLGVFYPSIFLVSLAMAVIVVPFVLRSGLMQNFAAGFSLSFVRDFLARTWKEVILAELFIVVSGIVVTFAGLLVFCLGVYPAAALVTLARYYLYYQLYELYLERGGSPISLQEEVLDVEYVGPRPGDDGVENG
jgi:hypothetical protein